LEDIEIIGSRPGQLSLAITKVKDNYALAREVEYRFGALRGIRQVETDASRGLVLIDYDRRELTSLFSLLKLKEAFSAVFPEINLTQFDTWLSRTL
jgi:hypothetical protein